MNSQQFTRDAIRTESPPRPLVIDGEKFRQLHAAIGLTTEAGELVDAFKKHLFYNKPLDVVNVLEEAGDALWYIALLLDSMGFTFQDAADKVIAKLKIRFPEKFTTEAATNRNLNAERAVLAQPARCGCNGWGCFGCCSSEAEIRSKQGTFS